MLMGNFTSNLTDKLVLERLNVFLSKGIHPKQSELAEALGCDRRTVARSLKRLNSCGEITVIGNNTRPHKYAVPEQEAAS